MVYIITKTFNSASWIYYGRREEGGRFLPKDFHRIKIPTAAALFPAEMLSWPPRSYAERMYNIKRWTKMPKGGHFAALEQPKLLIDDIRAEKGVSTEKLDYMNEINEYLKQMRVFYEQAS